MEKNSKEDDPDSYYQLEKRITALFRKYNIPWAFLQVDARSYYILRQLVFVSRRISYELVIEEKYDSEEISYFIKEYSDQDEFAFYTQGVSNNIDQELTNLFLKNAFRPYEKYPFKYTTMIEKITSSQSLDGPPDEYKLQAILQQILEVETIEEIELKLWLYKLFPNKSYILFSQNPSAVNTFCIEYKKIT